jgi:hypothetical protein
MGLFKKVKDILFDEEDVIEPEKKTVEPVKEEKPVYTEYKPPVVDRTIKETPAPKVEEKPENTFPFPDFDEEEFDSVRPAPKVAPRKTNVMDFERQKKQEKKVEYSRLEKVEIVDKKKFKPSPIISPVYGVLNEDYTADDITNKGETPRKQNLDVESVRKKAFGSLDKYDEDKSIKKTVVETETVTSYEPKEEKEQKVKTIDELLEDTSDVKIDLDDTDELDVEPSKVIEEPVDIPEKEITTQKVNKDEDTLENDLFDLIDSMYDTEGDK